MNTVHEVQPARTWGTSSAFSTRLWRLALLLVATSVVTLALCPPATAVADSESPEVQVAALLPLVMASPQFDPKTMCAPSFEELMLLDYMRQHPQQGREALHCNPILSRVARAHAKDMADHSYFDHVNADGYGPNYLVIQAGYRLPEWYPDSRQANNLESIGAHFATAADVWDAWVNSPGHRLHVLGLDPFFAEHTEIGVGYYFDANSEFGAYWVVITAPSEPE